MQPPQVRSSRGLPLGLRNLRAELMVSLRDLALATGISTTALHQLCTFGHWPPRTPTAPLSKRITDYMASRGATPAQLAAMFEPVQVGPGAGVALAPPMRAQTFKRGRSVQLHPDTARHPNQEQEVDMLMSKQVMAPATARHFKLLYNPYDGPVQRDEQFFVSEDIAYTRELLWQCARNASFLALVGESGAGKTTILGDLEDRLTREARSVVLIKPSIVGMEESSTAGYMLKTGELLHSIITTLDASATVPASLQSRTALATRLLIASARAGNSHLLAIEEAHGMPDATLRHLKRLHELREGRRPLLGILLLGQPELHRRLIDGLRSGTLREVAQRCEVATLPPLGHELQGYLECRAKACARPLTTLMEADAVKAISERLVARQGQRELPMSYPLVVNNLVTRAMNLAAEIGEPIVTAQVVRGI